MKILGIGLVIYSITFFWAAWHGLVMYQVQGDGRWFLTIVFCPIFGAMTMALGATIARQSF